MCVKFVPVSSEKENKKANMLHKLVVSTQLNNMLVKMGIFPKDRGEKKRVATT